MTDLNTEVKRLQGRLVASRKREIALAKILFDLGIKLPSESAEEGAAEDQTLLPSTSASSVQDGGEVSIDISRLQQDQVRLLRGKEDEGFVDVDSTCAQDQEKLLAKELEHSMRFEFDGTTFVRAAMDRGGWLAMLLVFQSFSSIILSRNVEFVKEHPTVLYFLTSLVGAGGNAGNQAAVRCIRGLAQKKLNSNTMRSFLVREVWMALVLAGILGLVGLGRAYLSSSSPAEVFAIVVSLMAIVLVSVLVGAVLPLGLQKCGVDPAHASTLIQVVMDILGVWITIFVTVLLLDPEFTDALSKSWYGTSATQSTLTG